MKTKTKILLVIAAILPLPFLLLFASSWWTGLPRPSFRRHFGFPIPKSVVIESKWGYASLAGSSEYIIFSIAPDDLNNIISVGEFKPVEISGENAGYHGTNNMIHGPILKQELEKARAKGLKPSQAFVNSMYRGMIYYLLVVDTNSTKVFYHYNKT